MRLVSGSGQRTHGDESSEGQRVVHSLVSKVMFRHTQPSGRCAELRAGLDMSVSKVRRSFSGATTKPH